MNAPKTQQSRAVGGGTAVLVAALGGSLYFASPELMDHLTVWEGRKYTVYADTLARGLPTVCKGITRYITDTPIVVGERWSREKCDREEAAAAAKIQHGLVKCFKVLPPQGVFDAASAFAWNVGVPAACKSQAMRRWNAREWSLGCTRLAYTEAWRPNWSSAGGVFVPGLFNRRKAEMRICLRGIAP